MPLSPIIWFPRTRLARSAAATCRHRTLGALLVRATKRSLASTMMHKPVELSGFTSPGYWVLDGSGMRWPFVHGLLLSHRAISPKLVSCTATAACERPPCKLADWRAPRSPPMPRTCNLIGSSPTITPPVRLRQPVVATIVATSASSPPSESITSSSTSTPSRDVVIGQAFLQPSCLRHHTLMSRAIGRSKRSLSCGPSFRHCDRRRATEKRCSPWILNSDFSNRVVVVFGGTSGINRRIAEAFAHGARVAARQPQTENVDATVRHLKTLNAEDTGFVAGCATSMPLPKPLQPSPPSGAMIDAAGVRRGWQLSPTSTRYRPTDSRS